MASTSTSPLTPAAAQRKTPERTPKGLRLEPAGALPLPPRWAALGALLSGLAYWLAFAGMDVWPLAFVAWVPLVVAMHRQTAATAARLGWLAGVTMNVAGFFWLQQMLQNFSGFPAAICFFF